MSTLPSFLPALPLSFPPPPSPSQAELHLKSGDLSAFKHPSLDASDAVLLSLTQLALSCTHMPTSRRPSMSAVVTALENVRLRVNGGTERVLGMKRGARGKCRMKGMGRG